MAAKPSKSSLPVYSMRGYPHARQPAGAHPNAIQALKAAGDIREQPANSQAPPPDCMPARGPTGGDGGEPKSASGPALRDKPEPPDSPTPTTPPQVTTSVPPGDPERGAPPGASLPPGAEEAPTRTEGNPPEARPRQSASKAVRAVRTTPARRTRREPNGYKLPPGEVAKPRPRSQHFRFPEEISGYLDVLANTFDCSKTHVVCSAIRAEWQRLRRQQAREEKKRAGAQ